MRDIRVDDDLYEYIMSLSEHGEGASDILRRELQFPTESGERATSTRRLNVQADAPRSPDSQGFIGEVTSSAEFRASRNSTGRYLLILSTLHAANPETFENVLSLSGRSRVYFADSREGIQQAGTSTHPQRIPGTSYWALTNFDTAQKRSQIRRVMELLGYSEDDADAAASAI